MKIEYRDDLVKRLEQMAKRMRLRALRRLDSRSLKLMAMMLVNMHVVEESLE